MSVSGVVGRGRGEGPQGGGWGESTGAGGGSSERVHGDAGRGPGRDARPASGMPRTRWEREASRAADRAPLTEPGAWGSLCNNPF